MKAINAVIDRLSWFSTMISLAVIGLICPRLLKHIIETYQVDEIKNWWSQ